MDSKCPDSYVDCDDDADIMVLVPSVRKVVCGKKEGRRHLGD